MKRRTHQTTVLLDADIKDLAMPIIQNKMHSSLCAQVNAMLKSIVENHQKDGDATHEPTKY